MKDMVPYTEGVFFLCILSPPSYFLQCDRLNKMAQRAIITDSSIVASNFLKWEGKGPHRNLLVSITSLFNHLMVLKESPVYVFLCFPHTLISKIVLENWKDWKMDINFDYTGAGTPQRNNLEELGFTMISERGNVPINITYSVYK